MRLKVFALLFWFALGAHAQGQTVTLRDGTEAEVVRSPAPSGPVLIWLAPVFGEPEQTQAYLEKVAAAGVETWYVDLVAARFLPRVKSSQSELPPSDVSDLIAAARKVTGRPVAVYGSRRAALLAIRGAKYWLSHHEQGDGLIGLVLASPSLYDEAPEPGAMPQIDPAVADLTLPVYLVQPQLSPAYWWLTMTQEHLAAAGARVQTLEIPGVRDGFFRRPELLDAERPWLEEFPQRLRTALENMQ
ncbi:MAG: hypothetical protein KDH88_11855 [Chromatiales bacterium]|nr:hypothetical protein [Chromatiales bacterium]